MALSYQNGTVEIDSCNAAAADAVVVFHTTIQSNHPRIYTPSNSTVRYWYHGVCVVDASSRTFHAVVVDVDAVDLWMAL